MKLSSVLKQWEREEKYFYESLLYKTWGGGECWYFVCICLVGFLGHFRLWWSKSVVRSVVWWEMGMKKVVTGGCGENLRQFPAPGVLHRDMGDGLWMSICKVWLMERCSQGGTDPLCGWKNSGHPKPAVNLHPKRNFLRDSRSSKLLLVKMPQGMWEWIYLVTWTSERWKKRLLGSWCSVKARLLNALSYWVNLNKPG